MIEQGPSARRPKVTRGVTADQYDSEGDFRMVTSMTERTNGVKAGEADMDIAESVADVDVSPEVEEKAAYFMDNYHSFLKERTASYVNQMADLKARLADRKAQGATAELSEAVTRLGYQYWNVLTIGPIQFFGDPPWRPGKIIAAGEWALILGVVWVNPAADPGGGVPGTVVLGGRDYRIRFETINLTNVTDGPDRTFVGTFPPVPGILFFPWFFRPRDPGPNPYLYQTHLTADITNVAQPFAAFSTWHLDLDSEPRFLGLPTQRAGFEHDIPCQYLVYRK